MFVIVNYPHQKPSMWYLVAGVRVVNKWNLSRAKPQRKMLEPHHAACPYHASPFILPLETTQLRSGVVLSSETAGGIRRTYFKLAAIPVARWSVRSAKGSSRKPSSPLQLSHERVIYIMALRAAPLVAVEVRIVNRLQP